MNIATHMGKRRACGTGEATILGLFGFARAARDPAKALTSEEPNSTTQGEEAMKSSNSRWAKLMSIGVLSAMLLSIGVGPAAAATTCKPGYIQVAEWLCITWNEQWPPAPFEQTMAACRNAGARVASYGDLFYLYRKTNLDAHFNPNGKWLGPELSADDQALCGNADITYDNDPDINNFEGTCNKHDWRTYWCAHDLD